MKKVVRNDSKLQVLSKSQFIKGLQCEKALWLYRHCPELRQEQPDNQHILETGADVGLLARGLYPDGVEVQSEYWDINDAIKKTESFINSKKQTIFEACARSKDGLYSKIDILNKVKGGKTWDLLEVKSSTSIKDYHYSDMAAQRYAFEGAGYKIRKSFLIHINSSYVRKGDLDVKELFTSVDCTKEVKALVGEVKNKLAQFKKTLALEKHPKVKIGSQCNSPFACEYIDHCWKEIPEYSVYDIVNGKKLDELLEREIIEIKDIPADFKLSPRRAQEIDSYKKNKIIVNKDGLKDWIKKIKYPIYFLDYETIGPAIPLFDNTSPYNHYPFQYSLHVQEKPNSKLTHFEFLHLEASDPRLPFVQSLIKTCGKNGSIVVYNQPFEEGINKKLAAHFQKYSKELLAINSRMIDLLVPFRERLLYHPKQMGSASIKVVLPAFIKDLSYDNLSIGNGGDASSIAESILAKKANKANKETIKQISSDLKKYCQLDTLAMVKLVEKIKEYIK